ncbi:SGF29 tudor-like domain-containing protein [Panaeolus papilionaceus]|nr:SGF29 tudor-like domain-containing protein [Panaeolus papilionaceus]
MDIRRTLNYNYNMDNKRRNVAVRPASSEERECWSHTAEALQVISKLYDTSHSGDSIGRVNRLLSAWPKDDTLPAEGLAHLKSLQHKLISGLVEIQTSAQQEARDIDSALERLSILIALRQSPEMQIVEKRNKRHKAGSPSGTPGPTAPGTASNRSVSITLPPRTNSVGPTPHGREGRTKKDTSKPQILQPGRKVVFRPPNSADADENTWIMAVVTRYLGHDKYGGKYEVQDAEDQDDGQPGQMYTSSSKFILPLPDPDAPVGSASHISSYPEFPKGSTVMALYPDTSCFYRAEVIESPVVDKATNKFIPFYKVRFEDDDDMEHSVAALVVVEFPAGL